MQKLSLAEWLYYPLKMEIALLFRLKARWVQPVLFFCLLVALFPMGLGQSTHNIPMLLPTLVWVAASLSALWSAESAFQMDMEDLALEQVVLSAYPTWLWLFIRSVAYWLVVGLPIALIGPCLAGLLGLPLEACYVMGAGLLLGLPGVCLLSLIASSLTLCLRNNGLLLVLMMLPLFIPFFILGVGSVNLALMGVSPSGQLAWLGVFSLFVLTFGPFAGGLGIQYSLDE